jgi:hypothetical protein
MLRLAVLVWLSQMLSVSASAQPVNDSCTGAKTISATPYMDAEDTTAATTDPQDPVPPDPSCVSGPCADPGGQCRGKSVWYVFTAPGPGTVEADTFDSDYDTILSAYTGSCGALQLLPNVCVGGPNGTCIIGCNDDDPLDGAQSKVSIQVSAATTYSFMASAFNNDGGNLVFHLTFLGTPPTVTPTASVGPTATPSVVPGPLGDANCDGRVTAADLPALAMLISADDRAPCRLDDASGDGVLNEDDISAVIEAIFER